MQVSQTQTKLNLKLEREVVNVELNLAWNDNKIASHSA